MSSNLARPTIFYLTYWGGPMGPALRLSLNNILSQIVPNVKYIILLFVICLFLIYNCIKKTLNWSCQHIASLPFESLIFYSKFFRCIYYIFICLYFNCHLFQDISILLYFLLLFPIQFHFCTTSITLFIYEPCIHMDVFIVYCNIVYV